MQRNKSSQVEIALSSALLKWGRGVVRERTNWFILKRLSQKQKQKTKAERHERGEKGNKLVNKAG